MFIDFPRLVSYIGRRSTSSTAFWLMMTEIIAMARYFMVAFSSIMTRFLRSARFWCAWRFCWTRWWRASCCFCCCCCCGCSCCCSCSSSCCCCSDRMTCNRWTWFYYTNVTFWFTIWFLFMTWFFAMTRYFVVAWSFFSASIVVMPTFMVYSFSIQIDFYN